MRFLPSHFFPESTPKYIVATATYLPPVLILISSTSVMSIFTPLTAFLLGLLWLTSLFALPHLTSPSVPSSGVDSRYSDLVSRPNKDFYQFQPLTRELVQLTRNNRWVGYGHQDKVAFVRAVAFCNFLYQSNPQIARLTESSKSLAVQLAKLPPTMSSEPIRSIGQVHYGYAYYGSTSDGQKPSLIFTTNPAHTPDTFPITYLEVDAAPTPEELDPNDRKTFETYGAPDAETLRITGAREA